MTTFDDFITGTATAPARSGPAPTGEQQQILDAFATGDALVVEAGAGTGKTTTLQMLAESAPHRAGRYIAFNRAIVDEATRRMPRTVAANTAHQLAYRATSSERRSRLGASARMRSSDIATAVGITDPIVITAPWGRKRLEPWRLASIVQRTVALFCQSADDAIGARHVPHLDGLDAHGDTTNQLEVAEQLVAPARTLWADLAAPHGVLPFKHEHYLKLWQLTHPHLPCDYLLCDEAQDLNPVIAAIVAEQAHAQRIYVGDSAQQIYAWTGAVNALATFPTDQRLLLSQSWRFGPAIAEVANGILTEIGTPLRLTGNPAMASTIGWAGDVDAVLCRTNGRAVTEVIDHLDAGGAPHLVGGGKEIIAFARAAGDLMDGRKTTHPDLACFDTWTEVRDYVDEDDNGSELKLLVDLVVRFGPRLLIGVLDRLPKEHESDLVVSTAHKAKGREWDTVRLAGDLEIERDPITDELPVDELRLLYVAVTRARQRLDATAVPVAWPAPIDREETS